MKPAKNKKRYAHSKETRRKIAAANTGKVFSKERRRNIGEAQKVILSEEQVK